MPEIVGEQFPALGKIDAGATVAALENAKPDGIFNVLFGADLTVFVREGNTRGLFEKRTVASLLTGEPEYIIPLGEETPEGWIVTGYPWEQITERRAQGLHRRLPRQVQRRTAARLAARLRRRLHDEGHAGQGRLHRHREAARARCSGDSSSTPSPGPVVMRASISSRPWAPGSARPPSRARRAP